MKDFWDSKVEVAVQVRINGSKVEARAFIDPDLWEVEAFREGEIRRLKQEILHEAEKKLHWRIEVVEP